MDGILFITGRNSLSEDCSPAMNLDLTDEEIQALLKLLVGGWASTQHMIKFAASAPNRSRPRRCGPKICHHESPHGGGRIRSVQPRFAPPAGCPQSERERAS